MIFLVNLTEDADRESIINLLNQHGEVTEMKAIPLLLKFDARPDYYHWLKDIPGIRAVDPGNAPVYGTVTHVIPRGVEEGSGQVALISTGFKNPNSDVLNSFYAWLSSNRNQAAVFEYDPTDTEGDGTGVNLYHVDSGIEPGHSQFGARLQSPRLYDAHPGDDLWFHGSATATCSAGETMGIAPGVTIYDSRCFPTVGPADIADLVSGMDAALDHFMADSAPGVMSCSFSGGNVSSFATVCAAAKTAGMVIVCSAGNNDFDLDVVNNQPAEDENTYAVGSIDAWNRRHSFSNYNGGVNCWARGDGWTMAYLNDTLGAPMLVRGTSMSCPAVAGMMCRMLTGTTKMTSAEQVDTFIADFEAAYTLNGIYDEDGTAWPDEKRLWIPGVSFTGFQDYTPPNRGIPDSMPIKVTAARTHAVLGVSQTGPSVSAANLHVITTDGQ